jgi:SWI/SNF-related matrix-associated actin-dependent regulator 1 of chromatin subfamily A
MREFAKWVPSLNVQPYHGTQSERFALQMELLASQDTDVLVTTYNIATSTREDRSFLRRMRFRSMILDEGHMVKSLQSARTKHLNSLKPPFRLLLTGTPLQNNLMELLSLLMFVMPDLFGSDTTSLVARIFSMQKSAASEESFLAASRIQRARQLMTPFILRRKKVDVLQDLPIKVREVVMCQQTPAQEQLYQVGGIAHHGWLAGARISAVRLALTWSMLSPSPPPPAHLHPQSIVRETKQYYLSNATNAEGQKRMNNILMQLRKAANHPLLFRKRYTDEHLARMAKRLQREVDYCEARQVDIQRELLLMSDFELHSLCRTYPSIAEHALEEEAWMDSGKVQKLQELLPDMVVNGRLWVVVAMGP